MRLVEASRAPRHIHVFSAGHGCAGSVPGMTTDWAGSRSGPTAKAKAQRWRKRSCPGSNGGSRRISGRGALRSVHPRALRHRRLALSDDADRRGRAALDRRSRARARARARGGRERAAARRRHLAVRPDGRTRRSSSTARNISTACSTLDVAGRRCVVEPGIVLDELNRRLKPHGLWFPVDISTASRATIGGMAGNNSCGARSLRYGNTRDNVLSIDAVLADGAAAHFGPVARDLSDLPRQSPLRAARARPARARGARGRRDRGALPQGAAPGRRLQSRRAGARPQRPQPRAHPGRLRRHARLLHRDRAQACAAARPARGRRLPFRQLPRGDGGRAAHRQARADRGRAGRPHHDRARARDRDVPPDDRRVRARRARGDPARRVRRGRAGRERAPPEAARRADGRSRLRLGQDRREMGRRGRGARSQAAGRASPRCAPPASTS